MNEHASPGPFSKEISRMAFQALVYSLQEFVNNVEVESNIPSELTQNPTVLSATDLFEREYGEH